MICRRVLTRQGGFLGSFEVVEVFALSSLNVCFKIVFNEEGFLAYI